ncbi:Putative beta-lactamase-inhibitor-like, PepSY-like [Salegentibacter holothuriorum]|uniref:Putative beta-lactamase-inhibitor-like, PepSY-like n=1 Tax=Salegentibacter holothuriorum TaxID=241145 RepID=A0A1T5A766_9FLAO|nr:PepSY-like domain-containing protein [Salegentibacter holothuriorum]SKB30872.1 Putative beta-lactamase-inhibitor-like, PepSY-like [Salegentibacter holothuriorum]
MKKLFITGLLIFFGLTFGHAQKSELPEMVSAYVSQLFPNEKIKTVEVDKRDYWETYEIKMSGGTELSFDQNNQPTEIKCKNGIPASALPLNIAGYITKNHPNIKILEYEMDEEGHEVELESGEELEFDSEGNFVEID